MAYRNKVLVLAILVVTTLLQTLAIAQQRPGPADGVYVKKISECPQLKPRSIPPAGPHDLRPDDIKIIAALGDSILAGFALEGVSNSNGPLSILNTSSITEYRGQSWGAGGDVGAITLANMVSHYNTSLEGSSLGSHPITICHAYVCLDQLRNNRKDVLNGALSGGIAMNLKEELDYLIPRMKELPGVNFETDWKMITIQMGSNDQCVSCNPLFNNEVTTEKFGAYMDETIQRIKDEIPRVVVNVVGSFNVSAIYDLTFGQDYCRPILGQPNLQLLNRFECSCFLDGKKENRDQMDKLSAGYNNKILEVYNKYKGRENENFAMRFTPPLIDLGSFPLEAISNMDCFHPGKLAHQWTAKFAWNSLYMTSDSYPSENYNYDADLTVYCPTEEDRIRVD